MKYHIVTATAFGELRQHVAKERNTESSRSKTFRRKSFDDKVGSMWAAARLNNRHAKLNGEYVEYARLWTPRRINEGFRKGRDPSNKAILSRSICELTFPVNTSWMKKTDAFARRRAKD